MKEMLSLILPARLVNLQAFVEAAKEAAVKAGMAHDRIFRLEIALEEVLINIMQYAYEGEEGEIHVLCGSCPGVFVIKITDRGNPFDATAVPSPDLTSKLGERRIGGLGIHLIKTFVDGLSYRREGGKNVLALTLSLTPRDIEKEGRG